MKRIYNSSKVRRRSISHIIEEVNFAKKLGFKGIHFQDDNLFTSEDKWFGEFCEEIKKTDVKFICHLIPLYITDGLIRKLKESGLVLINLGIQSGSDYVLKNIYRRNIPSKLLLEKLKILAGNKVPKAYDIIVDGPGGEKELIETINLVAKLDKPFKLRIYPLVVLPKTYLEEFYKKNNMEMKLDPYTYGFDILEYTFLTKLLNVVPVTPSFIVKFFLNNRRTAFVQNALDFYFKLLNGVRYKLEGFYLRWLIECPSPAIFKRERSSSVKTRHCISD